MANFTIDPTVPPASENQGGGQGALRIRNVAAWLLQLIGQSGSAAFTLSGNPWTVDANANVTIAQTLTLAANPTSALQAATKQYVDALRITLDGNDLPMVPANPISALGIAPKQYVDAYFPVSVAHGGNGTGAPGLQPGNLTAVSGAWPFQAVNVLTPVPVAYGGTGQDTWPRALQFSAMLGGNVGITKGVTAALCNIITGALPASPTGAYVGLFTAYADIQTGGTSSEFAIQANVSGGASFAAEGFIEGNANESRSISGVVAMNAGASYEIALNAFLSNANGNALQVSSLFGNFATGITLLLIPG